MARKRKEEPVSILDVALYRGVEEGEDGAIDGGEFDRVGLAIFGGCANCGATIGPWNAYPSIRGTWRCGECIGDLGFKSEADFEKWVEESVPSAERLVREIADLLFSHSPEITAVVVENPEAGRIDIHEADGSVWRVTVEPHDDPIASRKALEEA
jgi:hypothetical protein